MIVITLCKARYFRNPLLKYREVLCSMLRAIFVLRVDISEVIDFSLSDCKEYVTEIAKIFANASEYNAK